MEHNIYLKKTASNFNGFSSSIHFSSTSFIFEKFAVKITHIVFHKCSAHIFMGTRIVCGNENLRKKFLH